MRKTFTILLLILFFLLTGTHSFSQNHRLKVFIDCSNTGCDMDFIRTEITLVDFMLDRQAADVHVLITEQETGGGGSQYQFIFIGQNQFKNITDTTRFSTDANATDFEERDMLVKFLKLGLTPYVVRTGLAKDITIEMKRKTGKVEDDKTSLSAPTNDPWNYWVYKVGMNGHIDADEVYKNSRLSGFLSAYRVTEQLKLAFDISGGTSKSSYELEDSNGVKQKIVNKNDDYELQHYLIKSLTDHWSYGYEVVFSRSTFSNNKQRILFNTGVEYAIFPYKQVNSRFFTVSYTVNVRRNAYVDTTLFDKTKETLWAHGLESNLSFNQKWGTVSFGAEYRSYLHNLRYFNLSVNGEVDIRITGGLSFRISTSAELSRDQLYLPKEGATSDEVLTRRRELASGYRLFTSFGIDYRFGSKLNNFVNPRFR